MFSVGWGNLISHKHRHFVVPFEFGLAYVGAPKVLLNMNGVGCDLNGRGCKSLATDPTAISRIRSEQAKITSDISFLRLYPVISIGVGYGF